MTTLDALKAISSYPIPQSTIKMVAVRRGLDLTAEITQEVLTSKEYIRAEADIKIFLSKAPNISEAGITFNFSPEDRRAMRSEATKALNENGEPTQSVTFGYKGENL